MTKRKIIKLLIILTIVGVVAGGGTLLYVFKMPQRNIEKAKIDYSLHASDLVNEYLKNPEAANEKYLSEDGNSKILKVSGKIEQITENLNGQLEYLLKESSDKAGVLCSFAKESELTKSTHKVGDHITLKGVIRAGAAYDEDLGLYENVIVEKCLLIQ